MMKLISYSAIIIFLACSAFASENIRVAIANNQRTVTLKTEKGLIVAGSHSGRLERRMVFGSSFIGTRPVRVKAAGEFIIVNGKSYRGWIELRKNKNGLLLVVNDVDIEDYLQGVIASEIPYDWEFEALKAQAVASRTYALYRKKAAGQRPFHLRATVDGQVYAGRRGERERAIRAVRETKGIVITYRGEIIPAFYHSSCGGHTENAKELWGIDEPYLHGVDCDCQKISKYGVWEKRINRETFIQVLRKQGYRLNGISALKIKGVTAAGRVKQVAIYHNGGITDIAAEKLREAIGYSEVPSVFFEIEMDRNTIVISGRGSGHGVGLCQWGAKEMAMRGFDYKAILSHYYPGTKLSRINAVEQ